MVLSTVRSSIATVLNSPVYYYYGSEHCPIHNYYSSEHCTVYTITMILNIQVHYFDNNWRLESGSGPVLRWNWTHARQNLHTALYMITNKPNMYIG
jgi:hypothetical protein